MGWEINISLHLSSASWSEKLSLSSHKDIQLFQSKPVSHCYVQSVQTNSLTLRVKLESTYSKYLETVLS